MTTVCTRRWRSWFRGCPGNELAPGLRGPHQCVGTRWHPGAHRCGLCAARKLW